MAQVFQKQVKIQNVQMNNNLPQGGGAGDPGAAADPTTAGHQVIQEIEALAARVQSVPVPTELSERVLQMIERLRRMAQYGSYSGEFELVEKYVDWIVRIPWSKKSEDKVDLVEAKQLLDKHHYGMDSVKSLVLDYLAVMKLQIAKRIPSGPVDPNTPVKMSELSGSSSHAPIICFVGLQGVGKTSMAKSISQALGRNLVRISLGALGGVAQIRGQSRAFLDAEPGQIVKALVRAGTMNPVILLDEIDKVSGQQGLSSDVMAALLEILDPEQNSTFMDHYVDYPIDLSNVMFICTANNLGTLSAALLDRLEVIRFTSYTDEEKAVIAKDYIWPKVLEATAVDSSMVEIMPDVWPNIVRPLGFDAGIRQLERNLTSLCRHVAREIVEKNVPKVTVTLQNVKNYMPEGIGTLS